MLSTSISSYCTWVPRIYVRGHTAGSTARLRSRLGLVLEDNCILTQVPRLSRTRGLSSESSTTTGGIFSICESAKHLCSGRSLRSQSIYLGIAKSTLRQHLPRMFSQMRGPAFEVGHPIPPSRRQKPIRSPGNSAPFDECLKRAACLVSADRHCSSSGYLTLAKQAFGLRLVVDFFSRH